MEAGRQAVSVNFGPLTFSLAIAENWTRLEARPRGRPVRSDRHHPAGQPDPVHRTGRDDHPDSGGRGPVADHVVPTIGAGTPWQDTSVAFRVQNRNSGKVLGVDGMSTADSAQVVQFTDNGTADHNWRLIADETVQLPVTRSGTAPGSNGRLQ
jgi:Ricin-type beta-trefoil lectin domain-like